MPVVLHALTDQVARSAALSSSLTAPALPALPAAALAAGALPEGAGENTRMLGASNCIGRCNFYPAVTLSHGFMQVAKRVSYQRLWRKAMRLHCAWRG